jgi:hypothetical protein
VRDVLLIVDVLDDFAHEDGAELLASFRDRHPALVGLLERPRTDGTPVVFANDNRGLWDGDVDRLVRAALDGPAGELIGQVAPRPGDRFLIKPMYTGPPSDSIRSSRRRTPSSYGS